MLGWHTTLRISITYGDIWAPAAVHTVREHFAHMVFFQLYTPCIQTDELLCHTLLPKWSCGPVTHVDQSVMVKIETHVTVKPSIYWSIYICILNDGHKLWLRIRYKKGASAEGLGSKDRVRILAVPDRFFRHVPLGGVPDQGHAGQMTFLSLLGNTLVYPPGGPSDPDPDKQQKIDGWIGNLHLSSVLISTKYICNYIHVKIALYKESIFVILDSHYRWSLSSFWRHVVSLCSP